MASDGDIGEPGYVAATCWGDDWAATLTGLPTRRIGHHKVPAMYR
jgi:hypothetical protein